MRTIFVTGATGNQGGAVMRNLLSKGFHVKALVRDPAKLAAHENLEVIKGDLDDPGTYKDHLKGSDAVFCLLHYTAGVDKEVKQGFGLINAAKANNIKYFIYSSVIGCDLHTGIPHWESKFQIENHLKASGIDFAIIRPPSFYENLLIPQVRKGIMKGKLVLPTRKDKVQQFSTAEDVGKVALVIFSNPEKYKGRIVNFAAEQMNGEELATLFSGVMGKKVKFQQLPGIITRLALGRDLTKMFKWVNNNSVLFADIEASKKEFSGLLDFGSWIRKHFT